MPNILTMLKTSIYYNPIVFFHFRKTAFNMSDTEKKSDVERASKMLKLTFAKTVHEKVKELAMRYCYGCEVDHPSQTQHSCLMQSTIEHFYSYGKEAFQWVSANDMWLYKLCPADLENESKRAFHDILHKKMVLYDEGSVLSMVERIIRLEDRLNWE